MNKCLVVRCMSLFFLLVSPLWWSTAHSAEGPQTFTLDGRIKQAGTTTPILDPSVKIEVHVMDPSRQCVIYAEQQFVNTQTSNGYFNIQVGSNVAAGKRIVGVDPGLTMATVFSNAAAMTGTNVSGQTCPLVLGTPTYTPTTKDARYFRIFVTPSSTAITDTLADVVLDAVPNAIVAENALSAQAVGGVTAANLLQVNTAGGHVLTQSNLDVVFTTSNYSALTALLAGSSTLYNRPASNGTTVIPAIAAPSSPSAGQVWYNGGNILYHDGSTTRTISTGSSSSVSAGAGTAALPSISFSGDTDTGWYLAAPDTLAAATGGVERVRINENGNLGVGSTAPDARLTLGGNMTAPAWTSSGIGIRQNSATYTDSSSSGAVGFNYVNAFGVPTLASSSATTVANASAFSLYPPVPGTNTTITNSTGLTVNASTLTGVTRGYGMIVNAPTGATNNYAASLMGGNVGIGTTAPSGKLDVVGDGGTADITTNVYGAAFIPTIRLQKSRGTLAAPVIVNDTDTVMRIQGGGHDGTAFRAATSIRTEIDGTPGANDMPGRLMFDTALDGTAAPAERMRINNRGQVGIGTTDPSAALQIKAGTAAAGTAPLKLTAGPVNTTAEAGAIEFDGTSLFYTDSTNTRRTLGVSGSGITALTGDVTTTGSGSVAATITAGAVTTAKIADDNVTFAKLQNIATQKLVGRSTAATGDAEELGVGTGLTITGGNLNLTDTTDDDSFATLLGVCANGYVPHKVAGAWTCIEATDLLVNSSLVKRSATGNFAANVATFNGVKLNNAGSEVTMTNPIGAAYSLVLPVDDGTANQVLQTDGSGVLSWSSPATNGGTGLFANGTAAAPSISFLNDSNTGFYNPSNDSNVIATSTNGVERMRVTSTGNIGVGTTAPYGKLHLNGSDASPNMFIVNETSTATRNPGISLMNFDGTGFGGFPNLSFTSGRGAILAQTATQSGDILGQIQFSGTTGGFYTTPATIRALSTQVQTVANNGGALVFNTAANNTSTLVERMRIDQTGFVGIGTTSPTTSLEIGNAGSLKVTNPGSSANGSSVSLSSPAGNPGLIVTLGNGSGGVSRRWDMFASTAGFTLADNTAGATRMTVDGSGNVGIGITAPTSILHVTPAMTATSGNTNYGTMVDSTYTPASAPAAGTFVNGSFNRTTTAGASSLANASTTAVRTQAVHGVNVALSALVGTNSTAVNAGTNTVSTAVGSTGVATNISSGVITTATGESGTVTNQTTGTITTAQAFSAGVDNLSTGTITNAYGFISRAPTNSGGGVLSNYYGLYITTPTAAATNYAVFSQGGTNYFGGNVGVGTSVPSAALHIKAGTAAAGTAPLKLTAGPVNTTAEAGAIEFDGTSLFYTDSGNVRRTLGVSGAGITALTGDVTTTGSGSVAATIATSAVTTAKIADDNVTFAKLQNIATQKLIGRSTAATGDAEELGVGTGLTITGGNLNLTDTTDDDSFATLLGVCANGYVPHKLAGAWTCIEATDLLVNSSLVKRSGTGNFAANVATFNGVKLNNAGSEVTITNPVGAAYSLTLPVDDGTANQVLQTDGSGVLTWTSAVSGSGDFKKDGSVDMTGTIKAIAGTAALPGYTFVGDPNTGIYSPAADNVAVTVGGAEKMRLLSTGRLGIGSTAPTHGLDVTTPSATSDTAIFRGGSWDDANVSIASVTSSGRPALTFSQPGAQDFQLFVHGSSHNLYFNPGGNFNSPSANSMVFTSAGNLGIGTTAPAGTLDVRPAVAASGTAGASIWLAGQQGGSAGNNAGGSVSIAGGQPNGNGTAGAVTVAGGPGSNSNGGILTVRGGHGGTSSGGGAANLLGGNGGATSGAGGVVNVTGGNGVGTNQSGGDVIITGGAKNGTGTAGVIQLNSNVGIGTTAPNNVLDLVGPLRSASFPYNANLTDSAAPAKDNGGGLSFTGYYSPSFTAVYSGIRGGKENVTSGDYAGYLSFHTRADATSLTNERMRVSSAGNLGIGTTAPTAALTIKAGTATAGTAPLKLTAGVNLTTPEDGAVEFDGTNYFVTAGGVRNRIATASSGGSFTPSAGIYAVAGTVGAPSYSFTGDTDTGWWHPTADTMAASTAGAERVRIDSTGKVGIGTTAPAMPLHVANNTEAIAMVETVNNTFTNASAFIGRRARDAGSGVPGPTQAWDHIAVFGGRGYGTSAWSAGSTASMNVIAEETMTNTAQGAMLSFLTTPVGSVTRTEKMTIRGNGYVGIGDNDPQRLLHVAGPMRITASTVPSTPVLGDIYVDSGDSTLKYYNGTGWVSPAASGGGDFKKDGSVDMTGTLKAVAGTAALPGYTFVGDPNTGVYAPAADIVGVTTAGAERMRVTDTGTVGIGTTAPVGAFQVMTSGQTVVANTAQLAAQNGYYFGDISNTSKPWSMVHVQGKTGAGVVLWSNKAATGAVGTIKFSYAPISTTDENTARIADITAEASAADATSGGDIVIKTKATSGSLTERLRINQAGNVMVNRGNVSANGTFDVKGSIVMTGSSTGYAGFQPAAAAGSTIWTLPATDGAADEVLKTNGAGVLGWAAQTSGGLPAASGAVATPSIAFTGDLDTGLWRPGADIVAISTGAAERMRVDASGNVGIGTTSTWAPLSVNGGITLRESTYPGLNIENTTPYTHAFPGMNINSFRGGYDGHPRINIMNSNGTLSAPTAVVSGVILGKLNFLGRADTINPYGASVTATAEGTFTDTNAPTRLSFETTPTGTASNSERMRITPSGNVGIGTTAPVSLLDVAATDANARLNVRVVTPTSGRYPGIDITATGANLGSYPELMFKSIRGSAASPTVTNSGDVLAVIAGQGQYSTTAGQTRTGADILFTADGTYSGSSNPGYMTFRTTTAASTSPVERVRIDSAGNMGIGMTSGGEKLEVNGNVKATSFISTSDMRLKKDIAPVSGLAAILQLSGVSWNWKDSGKADMGVIAQNVETVFPQSVVTDAGTGFKAVKYNSLIAPLIEATKELYGICKASDKKNAQQDRQIASLKEENVKLKNEVEELKNRMERIEKLLLKSGK